MVENTIEYKRRIHVYETDMFQVVNHINYIKWFEEVRLELLRQTGPLLHEMLEQGYDIPLVENQCTYKKPLRFGQVATIQCTVEKLGTSSVHLRYEVYSEDGTLHATGRTVNVFIDASGTPTPIPEDLRKVIMGKTK